MRETMNGASKNRLALLLPAAVAVWVFLSLNRCSAQATAPPPPSYNPTNPTPAPPQALPSVSVGADDRVTFRIHAPEARVVTVNGLSPDVSGDGSLSRGTIKQSLK